jgi:hypothetical protein
MSTADQVVVKLVVKSDMFRPAVAYEEGQKGKFVAKSLVPKVGLEPTRGFPHRFLRPARLPFRHSGIFSSIACVM